VLPGLFREIALGPLVELAVGVVGAQPITEHEHRVYLGTSERVDVEIDIGVGPLEQPMLMPIGLANVEHIAGGFHRGHVLGLIGRIGDGENQIDDRLGGESRDRSRADMLERQDARTKRSTNARRLADEECRPLGAVIAQMDRSVVRAQRDNMRRLYFLFSNHVALGRAEV
jgi:hypothetical protein